MTAPNVKQYEDLKRAAAEKRKRMTDCNKENQFGLSSVRAVKIGINELKENQINLLFVGPVKNTEDEEKKQQNRIKHESIIKWVTDVNRARQERIIDSQKDWNQPNDWRFVTEKTLHKYIPFEKVDVNISIAFEYVTHHLSKFVPATKIIKSTDEDTPLWYMSRNTIRRTLYKAGINRHNMLTLTNSRSAHTIHPSSNPGGEL